MQSEEDGDRGENKDKEEESEEEPEEAAETAEEQEEHDTKAARGTLLSKPGVLDILKGSMANLPQVSTNTVRIFLSSTFSGEYIVF